MDHKKINRILSAVLAGVLLLTQLATDGNHGDDVYKNDVSLYGSLQENPLRSSIVSVKVAERYVSGLVFEDANRDGVRQDSEKLLRDIRVTLTDANGNAVTDTKGRKVNPITTLSNGAYEFRALKEGAYRVLFEGDQDSVFGSFVVTAKKVGDSNRNSDADGSYTGDVLNFADITDISLPKFDMWDASLVYGREHLDLGVYLKREISGLAWVDANNDGKREDDEALIPNTLVTLTMSDGTSAMDIHGKSVEPVVTKADGSYRFIDLIPGTYKIAFAGTDTVVFDNMMAAPQKAIGVSDAVNSDAAGIVVGNKLVGTEILSIDLPSIETVTKTTVKHEHLDSGFFIERKLSGLAFVDYLHDGAREVGGKYPDTILEDIAVFLVDKTGNRAIDVFGQPVMPILTVDGGEYLFEHLRDGEYQLMFKGSRWTDIKKFEVTDTHKAGVPETINNDAVALMNKDNLEAAVIATSLPLFEITDGDTFTLQNLDAGFFPPVKIEKTSNIPETTPLREGQIITYTLKINAPAYVAKYAVFSDLLPSGVTYLPNTLKLHMAQTGEIKISDEHYDKATGNLIFPILNYLKGTSVVTYQAIVDKLPEGKSMLAIENTGIVKRGEHDDTSNTTKHTVVTRKADVSKTAAVVVDGKTPVENSGTVENPVETERMQTVEYRITVTNVVSGKADIKSGQIVVTDLIPKDTSLVDGSINCKFTDYPNSTATFSAGVKDTGITWTLDGLGGNEKALLTFRVLAPKTSDDSATTEYETHKVFKNTAHMKDIALSETVYEATYTDKNGVEHKQKDTVYEKSEWEKDTETTFHVVKEPLITAVKTAQPVSPAVNGLIPIIKEGEPIAYTITLKNTGEAPAYNVIVRDFVPKGTTLTNIANGGKSTGTRIDWIIPEVAIGASATVSFTVTVDKVDKAAVVKNIALYYVPTDHTPVDPDKLPDDSMKTTNEVKHQLITLAKYADPMGGSTEKDAVLVKQGQTITYTIQLSAEDVLKDVKVKDHVPDGLTLVPNSIKFIDATGEHIVEDSAYNKITRGIEWKAGDIAAGVYGFTFKAVVEKLPTDTYAKLFTNTAKLTATNPHNDKPVSKDTNTITHKTNDGALDIHKTAALIENDKFISDDNGSQKAPVITERGQGVAYKLTITRKADAENVSGIVRIMDDIPSGTTLVPNTLTTTINRATNSDAQIISSEITQNGTKTAAVVNVKGLRNGDVVNVVFHVWAPTTANLVETPELETERVFTNTGFVLDEEKTSAVYDNDVETHKKGDKVYPESEYSKKSETTYHVIQEPMLILAKSSNPPSGTVLSPVGAEVTYNLKITNAGKGAAYNVVVRDIIPQFTTYVKNSGTIANGIRFSPTLLELPDAVNPLQMNKQECVAWVIEKIPAGETVNVQFKVNVSALTTVGIRTIKNVAQMQETPRVSGTIKPLVQPESLIPSPNGWTPSNEVEHSQRIDPSTPPVTPPTPPTPKTPFGFLEFFRKGNANPLTGMNFVTPVVMALLVAAYFPRQ